MNEYGTVPKGTGEKHWLPQTSEPQHACGVEKARFLDLMIAVQYLVQYGSMYASMYTVRNTQCVLHTV